ncbi:MAG: hypothetical protein K0Q68_333 [Moraxellaceae bacterium]|jgi:hypothetical protein|nr:hypothetical protein [Moraxellaceae bacterium]
MLAIIEEWIDATLASHAAERVSCVSLSPHFEGYFSREFLSQSYFVVTDELPKPDFPALHDLGLGGFLALDADGITYKDTYFIRPAVVDKVDLHFHELVHVAQWRHLGAPAFIERYARELLQFGYERAPLEEMAYSLQRYFCAGNGRPVDVRKFVLARC